MSRLDDAPPEFQLLLAMVCDETATQAELLALEGMAGDEAAMRLVIDYVQLDAELHRLIRGQSNAEKCLDMLKVGSASGAAQEERASRAAAAPSPAVGLLDSSGPSAMGYFHVGGMPFSYLAGAVICVAGLWIASLITVSHSVQGLARGPAPPARNLPESERLPVGRITGVADCRWAGVTAEGVEYADVRLGRTYALASGLLEITYDTGATVILQGPAAYEVDSRTGGFLSLGRLTARVDRRGATVDSPLFSVRTPTAIVTDLGTEFGVEVDSDGRTTSHVFRGSVKMQLLGGSGREREVVLRENQSARAENGAGAAGPRLVLQGVAVNPGDFVRRMASVPKLLDLLDIVAGGNGLSHRRERGIDAASGQEDAVFVPSYRGGDRRYHPLAWHKFIDGVFVPDGEAGPVKLDSAGHTFDGFTHTNGKAFGSIWARAAEVRKPEGADSPLYWMYIMGQGKQFMPDGRGLLGLHPNAGITFRLDAMRRAYAGVVPARFRAVVGMADAHRWAAIPDEILRTDVWIFVDGRLKWKRSGLRSDDGPIPVGVELGPSDRFLTLVSVAYRSVGGWVVFGDPVLQLESIEPQKAAD